MNPYRGAFYRCQPEWHGYVDTHDVERRHRARLPYFSWYTRGFLPSSKAAPILDIGCGSGQFLYFLREQGFTNCTGIDLDERQTGYGRELALDCVCTDALSFLAATSSNWEVISLLDILEHFTREELYVLLERVSRRLLPSGRIIVSVPNAESPVGPASLFGDITHETAFSATSLGQMLKCHGLEISVVRDPFPAPVSPARVLYRWLAMAARLLYGASLRIVGLAPPRYWSPVIWACARPTEARLPGTSREL